MRLAGAASWAQSAVPRPRGGSAAAAAAVGSAAPRCRQSCGSVSNISNVIGGGIQAAGRRPRVADWRLGTAAQPGGAEQDISGYTPANFISFSDAEAHTCRYQLAVDVEAPNDLCFDMWDDWNRIVDYMDLVSQIGLDPANPDVALFQCFYRWGMMPVLEIAMLVKKTRVEKGRLIEFETIYGMPASGAVEFLDAKSGGGKDGATTIMFRFKHQLPTMLVNMGVAASSVETDCKVIFNENLAVFKQVAEAVAADPSSAPPRQTAEDREIVVGLPEWQSPEDPAVQQAEMDPAEEPTDEVADAEGGDAPPPPPARGRRKSAANR